MPGKMGVDHVEMPLNLTAAQRTAKIKEIISRQIDLDEPLYEVSQEEWRYDTSATGSWVINEESVGIINPDTQEIDPSTLSKQHIQILKIPPRSPPQISF